MGTIERSRENLIAFKQISSIGIIDGKVKSLYSASSSQLTIRNSNSKLSTTLRSNSISKELLSLFKSAYIFSKSISF
jgi:hypothetical protein